MNRRDLIYWGRRLALFIMALLFLAGMAAAILSNILLIEPTDSETPFLLMILGDGLIPLILLTGTLLFRNRYCAVGAVILLSLNIFLRLSSVIIFQETFMPMDYFSMKMLFVHTDFGAMQAVMGKYFLTWLIPACLAAASVIIYLCILTWKTAGKHSSQKSRTFFITVLIFTVLSLAANILFPFLRGHKTDEMSVAAPLPIVIYGLTRDFLEDVWSGKNYEPIPLPQESREILLHEKLISDEKETKRDLFDRIIIIAIESMDYDFLSCNNPEMPENITPNLDRFSREYVSMKNYFCGAQPTSWGLTALLLSRFDYERDKYIKTTSLFTAAKEKGFHSYYFSSSPGYFEQNDKTYKQIFRAETQMFREEFFEKYNYGVENDWGLSDKTLLEGVFQELKSSSHDRFIAVISTIDTHPPYHSTGLSPEEKSMFPSKFLRSLFSTDREVAHFVGKIMQDPKLYNERTLIIITADHTATHGENYTKRTKYTPERIPLIFVTPNQNIFRELNPEKYASSIDLAPTILNLIDGDIPSSFMGRDLFSEKDSALTVPYHGTLLLHTSGGTEVIRLKHPEDKRQTAFRDFYYSFYGK